MLQMLINTFLNKTIKILLIGLFELRNIKKIKKALVIL